MLAVQEDFRERKVEVTRYFEFLRDYSDDGKQFNLNQESRFSMAPEHEELFKTLKANGFLLLYNLVESTLKNCIEAIFDEFKLRNVSFDHCRFEVRKMVIKNLKNKDAAKVVESLSSISIDLAFTTFSKDELVSGNVDAKVVRDFAKDYGFAPPTCKSDGLLTVKTNRNDLAHGQKSFSEVGRDFDLPRMDQIMNEVLTFLSELLASVAAYITNKSYLTTNLAP